MIKEKLSWIRQAKTPQAARWRITNFIRYARKSASIADILEPMNKALDTLQRRAERVVRRWTSTYTNARLEGLNSLFQAARARARGYRNNHNFITMIYMIASPGGNPQIHIKRRGAIILFKSAKKFGSVVTD